MNEIILLLWLELLTTIVIQDNWKNFFIFIKTRIRLITFVVFAMIIENEIIFSK
jgi:hypothetical protein